MVIVTIEIGDGAFIGRGETISEAYEEAVKNYELSKVDKKGRGIWEKN